MLSEQEVLAGLAKAGFQIPRSRFENWRERGLVVPRGTRQGLGRGKARAAHVYPDGTVEQAIQIAELRKRNLDLDEIGWRFWLEGHDVGRQCWFGVFKFMAKQFDACARAFRKAQASDEFVDGQIERMIKAALKAKTSNRFFRQIRKDLGPQRFAAVMNEVASMATGTFAAISAQQKLKKSGLVGEEQLDDQSPDEKRLENERLEDERAMDVALGVKRARTDTVGGVGPILPDDYSPILQATFEPLEGISLSRYLDQIDPVYLRSDCKVSAWASPFDQGSLPRVRSRTCQRCLRSAARSDVGAGGPEYPRRDDFDLGACAAAEPREVSRPRRNGANVPDGRNWSPKIPGIEQIRPEFERSGISESGL